MSSDSINDNNYESHLITLKSSKKIFKFFEEKNKLFNLDINLRVFDGINPRQDDFSLQKYPYLSRKTKMNHNFGGFGAIGCAISHFEIWNHVEKSSKNFHLIFEIDFQEGLILFIGGSGFFK